jgi:peptide/nickel transport system substrate-binding protein
MKIRLNCLLCLIVVTSFVLAACGGTPAAPKVPQGYNFTYQYHAVKSGGKVIIALDGVPETLNLAFAHFPWDAEVGAALWNGCVIALPGNDFTSNGFRPDQCQEVPTIANGGESADAKHTTLRIDPRAKWSDGQPLTADDFIFNYHLNDDPNIAGGYPFNLISKITKLNSLTFRIDWKIPFAPYLSFLWGPLPVHIYNAGKFAGVYNPVTGAYNSAIAQRLVKDDSFNIAIPVDNGPFTIKNVDVNQAIVLQRNPDFFSNYFTHGVALDQVTYQVVANSAVRIQGFRGGQYDHADGFNLLDLTNLSQLPAKEVVISSSSLLYRFLFSERSTAPNAALNGGTSIFADERVRQAFAQSLDRCAALRIVVNVSDCTNPNIASNDLTNIPEFQTDPSIKSPAFDPKAAAALLDAAGYHLVNGRRMAKDGKTALKVTITWPAESGADIDANYSALAQQEWEKYLGITVVLKGIALDQFFAPYTNGGTLTKGEYDIAIYYSGFGSDPDGLTYSYQSNQIPSTANITGANSMGFHDAQVDQLLLQGRSTVSPAARKAIYAKLDAYLVSQCVALPLFSQAEIALTKPTIGNYQQSHVLVNEWNIADWYLT